MSSPGYSRKINIPVSPTKSREPSIEPRSRSNSTARRDSIDTMAREFAENSEKLASRHNTDSRQVLKEAISKIIDFTFDMLKK